jgi:hypothetical protein
MGCDFAVFPFAKVDPLSVSDDEKRRSGLQVPPTGEGGGGRVRKGGREVGGGGFA